VAEALADSVGHHLKEWDGQIEFALNETMNCSTFLEFVYMSRDRIRAQLEYVRGNFTAEDEIFRARGDQTGSTTWAMTHMSTAASLVSAHMHIHGVLAAARPECLSENLQLLFLMSLRRLKALLQSQLRHLWVIFQGTSEYFRQGAAKWLTEIVELCEADLRTMESIMATWHDPDEPFNFTDKDNNTKLLVDNRMPRGRPGPPLPDFAEREPDKVALSTMEVLRRDTFEEWNVRKPLLRALLRHVLPRDGTVADVCAGTGLGASFLNDTGLVTAYALDPTPNIRLLSKGVVDHARISAGPLQLWRTFDVLLCLTAAGDFGDEANAWAQVWLNVEAHTTRMAILSCGQGPVREKALGAAAEYAPSLKYDQGLSDQLDEIDGSQNGMCIFWRK